MTAIYNPILFSNITLPTVISSNVVNLTNITLPTLHMLPIPTPNVTLIHPLPFTTSAPRLTARAPDAIETPDATDVSDTASETITAGPMSTTASNPLLQQFSELTNYPPGHYGPYYNVNSPWWPWPYPNLPLLTARSVDAPAPTVPVTTTTAQKSEYWGFPLTWVTSTKWVYDRPPKTRAVAGVAGAANAVMDGTNASGEDTDFDALLAAAWLTVEMPTPTMPTMPTMPGLMVPSTFATITRASSPSSLATPAAPTAAADIHKRQERKFYFTLTATTWKTVHFGGPFTITQTDVVTLETGAVMSADTKGVQPVVTVGGEW